MKLLLKTPVQMAPQHVWAGFTQSLFERLAPPLPRIKLLRFDGSTTGCVVEVELNFILFKQTWCSDIIDHGQSDTEIWFVDQGSRLPFFLKYWHHQHRLQRHGEGTMIVDDIEYRSGAILLDWLLYPLMWMQFAYRKPIYRRAFSKPSETV